MSHLFLLYHLHSNTGLFVFPQMNKIKRIPELYQVMGHFSINGIFFQNLKLFSWINDACSGVVSMLYYQNNTNYGYYQLTGHFWTNGTFFRKFGEPKSFYPKKVICSKKNFFKIPKYGKNRNVLFFYFEILTSWTPCDVHMYLVLIALV